MGVRYLLSSYEPFELQVAGLFTEPEKTLVSIAPEIHVLGEHRQAEILREIARTQMDLERIEGSYHETWGFEFPRAYRLILPARFWTKLEVYYGKDVAEYGILPLSLEGPFPKRLVIVRRVPEHRRVRRP